MTPALVVIILLAYFGVLMGIAFLTGENSNKAFFLGNKTSPWYVVAFGMIGASLSGVTFISIPGWVKTQEFSYMQMVLGYLIGYFVIANVLLPVYYKLNLTSIYTYLRDRLGDNSYLAGSIYFLISRTIGAAFRLYLVAIVFQYAIIDKLGWNLMIGDWDASFVITVIVTILLIWLYTFKGGIKTIIWTDTLQTAFMLIAVVLTIMVIGQKMNLDIPGIVNTISDSDYSRIFFFDDINEKRFFFKNLLAGAFIAIAMTGLDQDMMQKNLSCRSIGDAKKNMYWFSIVLVFVNLLFLALGALLYVFSQYKGVDLPAKTDYLYPVMAMDGHLGTVVAVFFILGLVAAAYSSADSALTSLTTSFCVDILKINDENSSLTDEEKLSTRYRVHIGFSVLLVLVIVLYKMINNESVISELFSIAGYTYGPLLGLYGFGLFTKRKINDNLVYWAVIGAPVISYLLSRFSEDLFMGYKIGFELLLINGFLCFLGLYIISLPALKASEKLNVLDSDL